MTDFVRQPIDRKTNRQHPLNSLVRLKREAHKVVSLRAYDLASISDEIVGARFIAADPNTGLPRMVISGEDLQEEFGVSAHFVGVGDDGTITFYVSATDGKLYAAGVTLDENGITLPDGTVINGAIYVTSGGDVVRQVYTTTDSGVVGDLRIGTENNSSTDAPEAYIRFREFISSTDNLLLNNPGFEEGTTDGWVYSSTSVFTLTLTTDSNYVHDGSYGLIVDDDGSAEIATGLAQASTDRAAVTPGVEYLFSIWVRGYLASIGASIYAEFFNSTDGELSSTLMASRTISTSWLNVQKAIVAPTNAATARIRVTMYGVTRAIVVDTASITANPAETEFRFDTDGNMKLNGAGFSNLADRHYPPPIVSDFMGGSVDLMIDSASLNGGTFTNIAGEANHPGILRVTGSAGSANTGGAWLPEQGASGYGDSMLLQGGEAHEVIFRVLPNISVYRFRAGWLDAITGAVVDGVFAEVSQLTLTGYAYSASTSTATTDTYALSQNTWYRLKVSVVSSVLARFQLYDVNGVLLWNAYVTTNIPMTAGQETRPIVATWRTTASATALTEVDWMAWYWEKRLTR